MNMPIIKMSDLDLANKRVLIREDLNVPLDETGEISDDTRIRAALPTIQKALAANARVIVVSHLGQPEEGRFDEKYSLAKVAERLSKLLGKPVRLEKNWLDGIAVEPKEMVLCENVRFNIGEKKNDDVLAKKIAALCDIFVMDAFATAHRAQASTHGVAKYALIACAGPLLLAELDALSKALENPQRPLLAIVGGAKVSTKIQVLENLLNKVDQLIVGGGIANTFIAASGYNVGKSLYEADFLMQAQKLLELAKQQGKKIPIPIDVVVAEEISKDVKATLKNIKEVTDEDMILDIGPETSKKFVDIIVEAKTIVWNGPVGVFEYDQFAAGTKALSEAIAKSSAFSIAGGGDTLAAIEKFKVADKISYMSTGGGAFLEFLQGKQLPAIAILQERAKQ